MLKHRDMPMYDLSSVRFKRPASSEASSQSYEIVVLLRGLRSATQNIGESDLIRSLETREMEGGGEVL